jgi:hypothetical protein
VQGIKEQQDLDAARARLEQQNKLLADAQKAYSDLGGDKQRSQLQEAIAHPTSDEAAGLLPELGKLDDAKKKVDDLNRDITATQEAIRNATVKLATESADASTNATAGITRQHQALTGLISLAGQYGRIAPEGVDRARQALDRYSEAQEKAAAAGVNFGKVGAVNEVTSLTDALKKGDGDIDKYVTRIDALAKALTDAAKAAADAKKNTGKLADFQLPVQGKITSGFRLTRTTQGGREHISPGHRHRGPRRNAGACAAGRHG